MDDIGNSIDVAERKDIAAPMRQPTVLQRLRGNEPISRTGTDRQFGAGVS
jgi:hypothetical protein